MSVKQLFKWTDDYLHEITTVLMVVWMFAFGFDNLLAKLFCSYIAFMAVLRIIRRRRENKAAR